MSKASDLNARIVRVMSFIETMIPDGAPIPGLAKLDIALKIVLRLDSSLVGKEPLLRDMFSEAKQSYNEVRALIAAHPQAGA
jgi:hypothetical protein